MPDNIVPAIPRTTAIEPRQMTASAWEMILAMAPAVHLSRMVQGVSSAEQAAFVLLRAYELGFPLSSVGDIVQVVQGRVCLTSQGMLALIQANAHRVTLDIVESTPERCTVAMKRLDNGFTFSITITIDDARQAGWIKQGGAWERIPVVMLRWRAIAFAARVVVPDLLSGIYLAAEMGNEPDIVMIDEGGA